MAFTRLAIIFTAVLMAIVANTAAILLSTVTGKAQCMVN